MNDVRDLNQKQLENLVNRIFLLSDYETFRVKHSMIHLYVRKDDELAGVRCRSWSPMHPVEFSDVVQLHAVLKNNDIDKGWFISLSEFSFDAVNFANNNHIVVVSPTELDAMTRDVGVQLESIKG